jgi:hypothetical protein
VGPLVDPTRQSREAEAALTGEVSGQTKGTIMIYDSTQTRWCSWRGQKCSGAPSPACMVARWCSLSAGGHFRPKGGAWRGAVASGWSGGAGALKMRARGRAEKRA